MDNLVTELSEENFSDVAGQGIALVEFWSPWCGSCRLQGAILEEVAQALAGRAAVGKVNVSEHPALARRFAIENLPATVLLRDGQAERTLIGLQSRGALLAAVESALRQVA